MNKEKTIFRQGSKTFFTSSWFFPRAVRQDVFDLYSFVRLADNYVDQQPADSEHFQQLRRIWNASIKSQAFDTAKKDDDPTDLRVVKNMLNVARKHNFDLAWIDSFLDSMQSDLDGKQYRTLEDTLSYVYGSAEVIGLMMANIMELKPESAESAKMQGRAMQIINFIRDLKEDNQLSRQYFPQEDLERFSLKDLSAQTAQAQPEEFNNFIRFQLSRYQQWQEEAYKGYEYIPKRLRIPVQTAATMYDWTAQQISKNPKVVFKTKIKPSKIRVTLSLFANSFKSAP